MTEEKKDQAIPEEIVKEVEKEVSEAQEKEIKSVTDAYTQKLSELEKKIVELTTNKNENKEEKESNPTDELKKQLDDSKKEIEKLKADFEKQIESIKLRKSIPTDVSKKEEPKKSYMELSDAEKDEIDREFFRSIGVHI